MNIHYNEIIFSQYVNQHYSTFIYTSQNICYSCLSYMYT